jgi:peptidoglycan/LPS O-acetylase OafA/YrhL
MPASLNRKYIPEIDQLRAFAATLVLLYHGLQLIGTRLVHRADFDVAKHWIYPSDPLLAVIEEGHTGVGMFIVLSGFILSLGAVGRRVQYRPFLVARILRIYPMLVVCVLVAMQLNPGNLVRVLTSLLPVTPTPGGIDGSFTTMFWAVAIEFQCYLVFPFLIAFSNQRGSKFLVQVIAAAFVLRSLAVFADGASPLDISYWTVIGRIDQFCIGMIAARLYVHRNLATLRPFWFPAAALLAVWLLWSFNASGGWPSVARWKLAWPTVEGAMWALVIVTYLPFGQRLPRWLGWLAAKVGEISYSTYLLHIPILAAVNRNHWYLRLTGDGYYDAVLTTLLVAFPVLVSIGLLTYHTIERPFMQRRSRYIVDESPS